jgi:CGNR zinc finger/Putative stress-induced transcription regulator
MTRDGQGSSRAPRLTWVSALPLDFVTGLINEWGTSPRQAAGEQDVDYPDFAALAVAYGLDADPAMRRMTDQDLTYVADALYPVFSAPTQDATIATVNGLLARTAPQPRLGRDQGSLAEQWAALAPRRLLVACVLTLYQQLVQWGNSRRLGLCSGTRCADVYVDHSRTGQKRFCSQSCQNRNRVAAFRARHRHPGGP